MGSGNSRDFKRQEFLDVFAVLQTASLVIAEIALSRASTRYPHAHDERPRIRRRPQPHAHARIPAISGERL